MENRNIAPTASAALPDLGTLVARARANTAEVIQAQNALAAAQESLEEQQRDVRLPDLTASVRYGPSSGGGLSASLNIKEGSAGLGYSLPFGGTAPAGVTQAELSLRVAQQNAELNVRTLYSAAQSAALTVASQQTAVEVARSALSAAQARLTARTGTADDVTAAALGPAQAERDLVQARAAQQTALLRIENAAGGSL
ncbi:TolC family protein [Deinococcus sp. SDU3-2]|uniref:TolC family protein n=1 Tax=Deinococcus terrestris TaxID=2651870 RepID=A0A7X1NTL8_9DEIO|nr:TolC family protein [Deinococcus terrestris]MPY65420.1 TolC family protein [Deinococcus terrestris]